jgi:hypothetical protein
MRIGEIKIPGRRSLNGRIQDVGGAVPAAVVEGGHIRPNIRT